MFSHAFEVEIHRHMHNATDLLYTGLLNQHAKKGESIHEHHDDIVARMPEHEQTIIKGLNRKIHEHGDAIQTHNTAVMQLGMGDETKMNKLSSKVRQSAFDYVDALKDNGDLDHEIVRQARGEVHAHAGGYDELMADHLPKIDVPNTAVPNTAGFAKEPILISSGCGTLLSSKSYLHKSFKLSLVPSALILVLI